MVVVGVGVGVRIRRGVIFYVRYRIGGLAIIIYCIFSFTAGSVQVVGARLPEEGQLSFALVILDTVVAYIISDA